MGVALVIVVMVEARKKGIQPAQKKATAKERWDAFKDAFWGFLMPVIILGGIYGGIFTPTEAAAVSVVYGLFVGMVIYREVKLKDLFDICVDSAKTTGGIMLIVASASLFSYVCTKFGIADAASALLGSIAHNQFTFLLIVNIIFLIAGCFIDANSAMYIFIPVMLPVCNCKPCNWTGNSAGWCQPVCGNRNQDQKRHGGYPSGNFKSSYAHAGSLCGRASCGYLYSGNFNGSSESTC